MSVTALSKLRYRLSHSHHHSDAQHQYFRVVAMADIIEIPSRLAVSHAIGLRISIVELSFIDFFSFPNSRIICCTSPISRSTISGAYEKDRMIYVLS